MSAKKFLAAGGMALAFYVAAFHEFPVEMTGDVSPNCNTDEVYDYASHEIGGMEHSHHSERYYLCDDDQVHNIYFKTGDTHYHINLKEPIPHTADRQVFKMGDRAKIHFNATLLEQFKDYRNRQQAVKDPLYPYVLHTTYGEKPFEISPQSLTIIRP